MRLQYASAFDFEVAYRAGKDHGNADGLSRPSYHTKDCDRRSCICVNAAIRIAQALEKYHEEPDFEVCEGILPSRSLNAYALTRAQKRDLQDEGPVEAATSPQPLYAKAAKDEYETPTGDAELIRKFLEHLSNE